MKLETDLSKLARWIIPGWMAILTFYVFVSTDILFTTDKTQRLFPTINEFIKSMTSIEAAFLALLVAAAGVPIGFFIYQTYFFFRWNSPFSRDGFLFPVSLGRNIDLKNSVRDFQPIELSNGSPWRLRYINDPLFLRDHAFQWNYIEALCLEAFQKIDSKYPGLSLYSRHRYLHEVLHTLGASVFATFFGFAGYLALKYMKVQSVLPDHILSLLVPVAILSMFLNQEEEVKRKIEQAYILRTGDVNIPAMNKEDVGLLPTFSFLHRKDAPDEYIFSIVSPGLLFIFSFGLFHIFGNPSLNSTTNIQDTAWRAIFAIAGGGIWMLSRKKPSAAIRYGDFLSISIALGFALLTRLFYVRLNVVLDWAYLTVVFEFLIIILILTKNRQNTKEEKAILEYYTLRRFITDKDYLKSDDDK